VEEAGNQVGETRSTQDAFDEARGTTHAREEAGSEESGSTEAVVTGIARGPAGAPAPLRLTAPPPRDSF
jgi:hypothetical protein